MHSDDFFAHPQILERVAAAFADPAVNVVYGDLEYISGSGAIRPIRRWYAGEYSPQRLAWGWMPPHPTLFMRRELYRRLGGFDSSFRIAGDYDLILRLFSDANVRPVYIPEVLVRMRMGGESNRSWRQHLQLLREDYHALRRNNVGGLGALCWKKLGKLGQFF
jgi:GT2 family glycosyltransferase